MRIILHVDMDAFFASAELTRHPEWRGKPVVVGSDPHKRGVVSTCSYEARKFGIHSAMPSRTAYKLCPDAIFTRPDMDFYHELSRKAFEVFSHYSPFVEGVSVDEAFLDITGTVHLYDSAKELGDSLRNEIREICGVTCSVGIAINRLLAKIGSEVNKPDGLTVMPFDAKEIAEFLAPKPIGILWGVGRKMIETLAPYGITTCRDLQNVPLAQLATIIGGTAAKAIHDFAFGISSDVVAREDAEEKSVSREYTFEEDEFVRENVRRKLLDLVGEVGYRFRQEQRWARTARFKFRDTDFNTYTRQMSFDYPTRDDISFRKAAFELFDRFWPDGIIKGVRLIGFGVSGFQTVPGEDEPLLFAELNDNLREKRESLSKALDSLRDRGISL